MVHYLQLMKSDGPVVLWHISIMSLSGFRQCKTLPTQWIKFPLHIFLVPVAEQVKNIESEYSIIFNNIRNISAS